MRDRVTDLTSLLYPAEGLDPASKLFSSPPIESLEWLKELGDIARASFVIEKPSVIEASAPTPTPPTVEPIALQSDDSKLVEALHEFHRLRSPALGARAISPSSKLFGKVNPSTVVTRESGFSSIEIPIVQDYIPKTSASPYRSSHPVHTVLKSKPRP